MRAVSIPGGIGRMHAHLRLLLLLTVLVRGGMFLATPSRFGLTTIRRLNAI